MAAKYEEIQKDLYRRLIDGTYPLGSRLPTEKEFAEEYSVNRHTVRRVLAALAERGLVSRTPGRGTIVTTIPGPNGESHAVTIRYRYFSSSSDCPRTREATLLIERFTALHPHIHVELATMPQGGAYMSPPVPEMLGAPCATVMRYGYMADYAKRDALLQLDQFDDLVDVVSGLDGRLIYRTPNGHGEAHIQALPVEFCGWMMVVNRSLLRKLGIDLPEQPMTWDSFIEVCREVNHRGKAEGIRAIQLGITQGEQTITRLLPYFYAANGGQMLVDPETCTPHLSTPGNEKALAFLSSLVQEGLCHLEIHENTFVHDNAVFGLAITSASIRSLRNRTSGSEIELLPCPVPDKTSRPYTVVRGDFVGILAHTVHSREARNAAWEFVKFLVSAEAQEMVFRAVDALPSRDDLGHVVSTGPEELRRMWDYGKMYGVPTFDMPKNGDIHNIIRRAFCRALHGECSPAQALAEGDELLHSYVFSMQSNLRSSEHEYSLVF
jgi:ABC-type glycerol-3-phosphate transport system substrate-binding protein